MNNKDVTNRVEVWMIKNNQTKLELSAELGVSRPTLDKRLKKHNWKKLEIKHILNKM